MRKILEWFKNLFRRKQQRNTKKMRYKGKKDAIKKVQAALRIVVDGIAGPKTWGAIAEVVGAASSSIKDVQAAISGLKVDGKDGPKTWEAILNAIVNTSADDNTTVEVPDTELSQKAYDLILKYEVSSKQYYNRRLAMPTWPGGASGVTIGIGYDLGYNTAEGFRKDWGEYLPKKSLDTLAVQTGKRGSRASSIPRNLSHIKVPWDAAEAVFKTRTLPRFIELTKKTFPGSENLHPDAFGALVSLIYNRGSSVVGSTRVEMANIRKACLGEIPGVVDLPSYIAAQIRSMKRIWKYRNLSGLLVRRDAEADLIERSA